MTEKRELSEQAELRALKARADKLGITYSPNIGLATLANKIDMALLENPEENEESKPLSKNELRKKIQKKALRLVRCRIHNHNPQKQGLKGELIAIASSYLGVVRKFIPFEAKFYVNGYHIPYCIYRFLLTKTYLSTSATPNRQTGQIDIKTDWLPEYTIEVLEPLTKEEIKKLAADQRASGRLD